MSVAIRSIRLTQRQVGRGAGAPVVHAVLTMAARGICFHGCALVEDAAGQWLLSPAWFDGVQPHRRRVQIEDPDLHASLLNAAMNAYRLLAGHTESPT
ncbi:hypothetical protein CRT60_16495 [Azospirillum palustre]|uniref:Uncharacterized protein n=1 Tax=Azospirillum palustre TaxID=2044885 RepID=A0A2B8BF23_9PROT|nr:hypothetical protein [Azospirillum palustre]PGH56521.1 hypothetical protein CRT60_16495 [Azospirillum palustre]